MIQLDIENHNSNVGSGDLLWGRHTFILFSEDVKTAMGMYFGRSGVCLKVFPKSAGMMPDEYRWGSRDFMPTLDETTKAQNLLAMRGLAPRVYGIVRLKDECLAQVTEFVEEDSALKRGDVKTAMDDIALVCDRHPRLGSQPHDWRGGLLVDCCGLRFANIDVYLKDLRQRASATPWGRAGTKGYQGADEIGLDGRRDLQRRVEWMRLDEVDFTGKSVLDLGCNLGCFCREAARRGAVRAVGVDVADTAGPAFEIANWAGLWNVDFFGLELPDQQAEVSRLSGIQAFDIVFLLATVRHIGGYADWISKLCAGVLYLEGHSVDKPETYRARLEQDFREVEYMGQTKDHFSRPLFRCVK